jgi:hypothetical protein
MAAPSGTFLTTASIGNHEDLTDFITRISPTDTPVMSMCAKTKATNTLHEWQTQVLASAASNAQTEGDDASAKTVTPTVRLTNRTQISTKTVVVSGSQQSMNTAGRKDEMGYQMSLAAMELKRDMEFGLTQNDVLATSPRKSRGLLGWTVDNYSKASDTTLPSYTGNTAITDGTTRNFTETQLKSVLQQVYISGGKPDTITMGAAAKQTFSGFTGGATRQDNSEDKKVTAAVDVYVSDFGTLKAVPDLFQRTRDVFILESDKLAIAYYRPMQTKDLAPTGDAEKKMLVVEYCLEVKAPAANGVILDIA